MQPRTTSAPGLAAPDIAELQPLFPGHELQTLLGRGGMGFVYRARHRKLDRIVALKLLRPDLSSDPAFAERFEREARALAMLDHPGIVGIHDFGQAGDYFYLVMDFVDGANLREVLAQGCLTTRDILAFVPQLCDALQYLHDHRVVHRDIKPENILVDQEGRVHIADFGLAKLLGQEVTSFGLTQTHQALGTPHYMAPEQVAAAGGVDHRADLYSLGVVLYEMLTGKLPIGRFQPPSARATAARAFDPVVMKSLENDPDERYQTANEVKVDVQAAGSAPTAAQGTNDSATAAASRSRLAKASRKRGGPLRDTPDWMMWHIWVASICFILFLVGHGWLGFTIYMVFLGLSYLPIPAEYREPHDPTRPQPMPWSHWMGSPLILVACNMKWATYQIPSITFGNHTIRGNAFNTTLLGVPCWSMLVLAILITILGTLRARGHRVPPGAIMICSSIGTVFMGLFVLTFAMTANSSLGGGAGICLLVFFLWSTFELRRQGEALQRRSRRHQP